jgi:hypothetical protein
LILRHPHETSKGSVLCPRNECLVVKVLVISESFHPAYNLFINCFQACLLLPLSAKPRPGDFHLSLLDPRPIGLTRRLDAKRLRFHVPSPPGSQARPSIPAIAVTTVDIGYAV